MIPKSNINSPSFTLRKGFEVFFKESFNRLYYYALRYIPEPETCKDIVSDSFHYMWERIDTVELDTALTFMYTNIRFRCLDHIRHAKMKEANIPSYIAMLETWDDDEWRESEERIEKIMELIDEMPPKTQEIMKQCYIHKKKYKEVAEIVELSESGVRKHIMKGLDIIRQHFSVNYKKGGN